MRSILAGATAGAVEICKFERGHVSQNVANLAILAITYPAECTQTLQND